MTGINSIKERIASLCSVFFISISLFVYQVVLTRIYSAILSYNYVFLITSFAIFGLGIGSIFAYKKRQRSINAKKEHSKMPEKPAGKNPDEPLSGIPLLLAACYLTVLGIIYFLPYVKSFLIYILFGTIPFVIAGYFFSSLFREFPGISSRLYFADLIGSGVGSMLVLLLLNRAGMFRTIIFICITALLPAIFLTILLKKSKVVVCALMLFLMAGILLPGQYVDFVEKNFNGLKANTGKTLGSIIQSGSPAEVVYTKWNAFSRTDVIKIDKMPDTMVVTIDGAANAPMLKFDGKLASLDILKKDVGFLPFIIGKNDKTLVIGPGGGRDILYALAGGSKDISAVEINTSSIDAVNKYSDFNGNIYNRPGVKIYGEDGRNFVRRTKDTYDLIFLSLVMTSTSQGVGYALSENYIFTVEAMEDYLDRLNDNGKIAFLTHDQEDLGKIVATAMFALKNKGIAVKDTPKYIALFAGTIQNQTHSGGGHLHNPIVIIKNKPFTQIESRKLVDTASQNSSVSLFTPLVYEQGPLQLIKTGNLSMAQYLTGFSTNVTPATDDSPYFYNFNKGIPSTLLLILFFVSLGSIILFTSFVVKNRNLKPTLYFGLLGAGFMMIEIPLIQKFTLYFGHPVTAFTYVLAALLAGCGLGAYMSGSKLFNRTLKNLYMPPILVVVVNIAIIALIGVVFKNTSGWSLVYRIMVSSLIVMIQGFFMGMPFPRGIKLLGEGNRSEIIPVMWGINGVMSVIGSVMSIILSMLFGFNGALIAGAIIYTLVSLYKSI